MADKVHEKFKHKSFYFHSHTNSKLNTPDDYFYDSITRL